MQILKEVEVEVKMKAFVIVDVHGRKPESCKSLKHGFSVMDYVHMLICWIRGHSVYIRPQLWQLPLPGMLEIHVYPKKHEHD